MQSAEQARGGRGGALRGGPGARARHGGHRAHRARYEVRGGRRDYSRVSMVFFNLLKTCFILYVQVTWKVNVIEC